MSRRWPVVGESQLRSRQPAAARIHDGPQQCLHVEQSGSRQGIRRGLRRCREIFRPGGRSCALRSRSWSRWIARGEASRSARWPPIVQASWKRRLENTDTRSAGGFAYGARVSATNRNDWQAARQDFLKAYSLDPNSAFSLNNLGYVSERDGDLETAQFFYTKAQNAGDANARVGLASDSAAEGEKLRHRHGGKQSESRRGAGPIQADAACRARKCRIGTPRRHSGRQRRASQNPPSNAPAPPDCAETYALLPPIKENQPCPTNPPSTLHQSPWFSSRVCSFRARTPAQLAALMRKSQASAGKTLMSWWSWRT